MYIHRPFTQQTTLLTIVGQERRKMEKNWAPFFYHPETTSEPSKVLHFVYGFEPLAIVNCSLQDRLCHIVYRQAVPVGWEAKHTPQKAPLRGGTNFIAAPFTQNGKAKAFVGLARTHVYSACYDMFDGFLRPILVMLVATSAHDFHLSFVSEPIDFAGAAFESDSRNPCGSGGILIPSSITRWTQTQKQDVIDVAFSVDDKTTQVLRLKGVHGYLQDLSSVTLSRQSSTMRSLQATQRRGGLLAYWCSSRDSVADIQSRLGLAILLNQSPDQQQCLRPREGVDTEAI